MEGGGGDRGGGAWGKREKGKGRGRGAKGGGLKNAGRDEPKRGWTESRGRKVGEKGSNGVEEKKGGSGGEDKGTGWWTEGMARWG